MVVVVSPLFEAQELSARTNASENRGNPGSNMYVCQIIVRFLELWDLRIGQLGRALTSWRVVPCPRREWGRSEASDIDEAPIGVSFREKTNQSNLRVELPLSCPPPGYAVPCPRREYGRREPSRIDEARRANERERMSQSNLRNELPLSCPPKGALLYVPGGIRTHI